MNDAMNDPCYSFGSNLDVAYEIFFPHCTLLYVKEAINIFEEPYRIIFENRHCQEEKNTIHSDFTNSLLMGAGSSMSMVEHKDLEGHHPDKDTWEIEEANSHRHQMEEIVRGENAQLTVSELLYDAAFNGEVELCNDYIDRGANVEYASVQGGMTPLHIAAMNDHTDVCKLLIDRGAYAMSKDHSNKSPGNYAEANGNHELAKLIRQLWLEKPSPKGLKPMNSMGPDWQPNLRNVKQYGVTFSKPKFIAIDNRTSGVFHEAAVRGFNRYHSPQNETNNGFRATISMSTYGREGEGMSKSRTVIHHE